MNLETRADFARRLGWNRSSVTRAVQDGRVVLSGDLVDIDASLAKIEALAHTAAHHQAHARQLEEDRQRKQADSETPTLPAAPAAEGMESLNLRLKKAEADKREHEAEIARMDREQKAGNLIARDVVDYVLTDYAATLRSLIETRADRLAPVIHPLQTLDEVHAALAEADESVLHEMTDAIRRKAEAFEVA
jgi:hypothetical protein